MKPHPAEIDAAAAVRVGPAGWAFTAFVFVLSLWASDTWRWGWF